MVIRTAVVGAGHIACEHMACLRERPGVELAGVCDLSPALAQSAAERYGAGSWFTDYDQMFRETTPDVVHVATPAATHFEIAMAALDAGSHIFVEKPITARYLDLENLCAHAQHHDRILVEDHNYLFNESIQRILAMVKSGRFGDIVHVEVMVCLNLEAGDHVLADVNLPHPSVAFPSGVVSDFFTHMSYLTCALVGPHQSVQTSWAQRSPRTPGPYDEFRALVDAERGSASLMFSARAQPDAFVVRVQGTKMRAEAHLFEPRLTIEEVSGGIRPLAPIRNARRVGRALRSGAWRGLWRKLRGEPVAYEGLWRLVDQTYAAIAEGEDPPVSVDAIRMTNRLVADLTEQAPAK